MLSVISSKTFLSCHVLKDVRRTVTARLSISAGSVTLDTSDYNKCAETADLSTSRTWYAFFMATC